MPKAYSFDAEFDAPVTEVWRVVSDTDLIDGAIGLPAITYRDEPQPDGTSRRFCSMRKLGILLEYEELPFSWVHEQMPKLARAPAITLMATGWWREYGMAAQAATRTRPLRARQAQARSTMAPSASSRLPHLGWTAAALRRTRRT